MPRSIKNRFSQQITGELDRHYHVLPVPRFTRRVMGDDRVFSGVAFSSDRGDYFAATDNLSWTNSALGIFSCWIWNSNTPVNRIWSNNGATANSSLTGLPSIKYFGLTLKDSGANNLLIETSSGDPVAGRLLNGTWNHILCTWDLTSDNLSAEIYINDVVSISSSIIVIATGTVEMAIAGNPGFAINSLNDAGSSPGTMNISEFWMTLTHALDLSVIANRRLFITEDLRQADLGRDGSKPTATQPDIYLSGRGQRMFVNRGSAGQLSTQGGSPRNNVIAYL